MTQFPKSLLIALAILLVLLIAMGAYSVRGLGGAYRNAEKNLIESE